MTSTAKKNSLSREQAQAMYEDLRKNFAAFSAGKAPDVKSSSGNNNLNQILSAMKANSAQQATYKRPAYQRPATRPVDAGPSPEEQILAMMLAKQEAQKESRTGSRFAVAVVLLAAGVKLALGAIEYSGVMSAEYAQASTNISSTYQGGSSNFSPEQVALLKALDTRRAELEERRRALDKREEDFSNRDREFAIKLAELRELTATLKGNRETESKKKTTQLDQLSNVYGSMDPKEAAQLIEQLDDTIAIELLNRMPEKRIGQILSLMNREKALIITKMLSGKIAA